MIQTLLCPKKIPPQSVQSRRWRLMGAFPDLYWRSCRVSNVNRQIFVEKWNLKYLTPHPKRRSDLNWNRSRFTFNSSTSTNRGPGSVPNSISVFKDTPHFTNTIYTFTYGLRRSYQVINTARISYGDLHRYGTGPYTSIRVRWYRGLGVA
jgi:hypothetical protein